MTYDGEWKPSLLEHGGWTTCQQVFDLILAVTPVLVLILALLFFTSRQGHGRGTGREHRARDMQYGVYMSTRAMLNAVAKWLPTTEAGDSTSLLKTPAVAISLLHSQ